MSLLGFQWGPSTGIYLHFTRKMKFKRRLKNYVSIKFDEPLIEDFWLGLSEIQAF